MSSLRIKGDINELVARRDTPKKGLTKRIVEAAKPKRQCPRCKRDLPYDKFFYRSFKNQQAGLPTATPSHICNSCRNKRKAPRARRRAAVISR